MFINIDDDPNGLQDFSLLYVSTSINIHTLRPFTIINFMEPFLSSAQIKLSYKLHDLKRKLIYVSLQRIFFYSNVDFKTNSLGTF